MARSKIEYIACPKCGNKMPKGSTFCSSCGSKMEEQKIEYIICKHCGNETPKASIFCMVCGSRLVKLKTDRDKKETVVPEPKQLPSGKWFIHLRINDQKIPITRDTYAECKATAIATKSGLIELKKQTRDLTLYVLLDNYITANDGVLSPSTVRSYKAIQKTRFAPVMNKNISCIDWQTEISREAKKIKPKTLINAWRLVRVALKYSKQEIPDVRLPQLVQKETHWLDYEQIQTFLKGIYGRNCELVCLLALHSLRISEILALKPESLKDGYIQVRGAVVPNSENVFVYKSTNKNETSRRDVPVMIPRLLELWPKKGEDLKFQSLSPLRRMIERICKENDLPIISIHGLRHSFASLAYHLDWSVRTTCAVGGWSTPVCVERIYTHLSKLDKNEDIQKMKEFYNHSLISQKEKKYDPESQQN